MSIGKNNRLGRVFQKEHWLQWITLVRFLSAIVAAILLTVSIMGYNMGTGNTTTNYMVTAIVGFTR